MSKELLLLRHAKSDWNNILNDLERPLAKRGKRDIPLIGAWLAQEGLVPDHVISSTAMRARQTALKICKFLNFKKKRIIWEPTFYEAQVQDLIAVLARCSNQIETILLIGHNPSLEQLIYYCAAEEINDPSNKKLLPTAAVARLKFNDNWDQIRKGCARLLSVTRPRELLKQVHK